MRKKGGTLTVVFKKNSLELFNQFMEKVVTPLKEKYPYADIRIEVQA